MIENLSRPKVLEQIALQIHGVARPHPVRVALDGVDAAGKTTLADELTPLLENLGRPVIRASVDGFHNPREVRYRRGENSPEGYYRDSFDYAALLRGLLMPLGPGGNRQYRRAVYDFRADVPVQGNLLEAPQNAILLFDGVFLLRPGLSAHWDFSIFLEVDFSISVPRAVARDLARPGSRASIEEIRAKYEQRYVPGQKLYLLEARPQLKADAILDNNDPQNPRLILRV